VPILRGGDQARCQDHDKNECYKRGVLTKGRVFKMPLKWTQMLRVCDIKTEYIGGQGGRTWH